MARRTPARPKISRLLVCVTAASLLLPELTFGQALTGALIGTVRDQQGGAIVGAVVRIDSPSLLGAKPTLLTDDKGQFRFPALNPSDYSLEIEHAGFATHHEVVIPISAGATTDRNITLRLSGLTESVVVDGGDSNNDARASGLETRFRSDYLRAVPTRRSSMFDTIRTAPGVSPTSPSSGTITTVSVFGSGTNENQFFIDGTPTTCPCNGVARAEPGVDFIQEVQVQSVGASAEFGNLQGAVFNVVTRQGGARFQSDVSYYGQPARLTSQPVRLASDDDTPTGYERARYRDLTATLGGPAIHDRLWFFGGYQYLRDYDSQPGTDPSLPRTAEQDKIFAKLTWKLKPGLQLLQSLHDEFWVRPDPPTRLTPFAATLRRSATVPAMTFGHLTHILSDRTVWDARVGRFVYEEDRVPSSGDRLAANHSDRLTGISSGAPPQIGGLTLIRTTAKVTINHYRGALLGAAHEWKVGGQLERGEQRGVNVTPTGVRYVDINGQPAQSVTSDPSHTGGSSLTASAFVTDAVTAGDRLTMNLGLRFDQSRAISQDLRALDSEGLETDRIVYGLGTLYTWNIWSPRLGVTAKLTTDGRTMLRASYGRYSQGVLTGEFSAFHPGVTPTVTTDFNPVTGDYTGRVKTVDSKINLRLDPGIRAPHTDEYSVAVDRQLGRRFAVNVAYVRKSGTDFIGWEDVGGVYRPEARTLADGRVVPVFVLQNSTADQRFLLTNPDGYSMTYNGLVLAAERRPARGWRASGSYTFSRVSGLQASSGTTAAGAQASTVAAPTPSFGRDPNDLSNARGRLANDRPHVLRVAGNIAVAKTGLVIATNLQHFSGKPWAAVALVDLPQIKQQRLQLEPRGSRRLSSQTLLDVRISRAITSRAWGRVEVLVDVLNALNDTAEESLTETLMSATQMSSTFSQAATFIDPRRAMIGVRLDLGR
jgi:hypothetical protein